MTAAGWRAALLFLLAPAVLTACAGSHQANPLPGSATLGSDRSADARTVATTNAASASMCSIYSGFGALSFCYDFDETSGTTLLDASGAAHNGTISSSGVTYRAAGISTNSSGAETTDGSTGSMTSGFAPGSGSFSFSFFVDLKSNGNSYGRLAATGDPKNSSDHSGWYIAVNSGSTNPIFASLGSGSGSGTSVGFIPLALNTPANVTLTYNASNNQETLCVSTGSSPTCASQTLPAAYVPSGNAITFGGAPKYYPANATFDESAFFEGTVLSSSQISTIGSYAGAGGSATPSPAPTVSASAAPTGGAGLCSTYAGFGSPAFCYHFDESSGTTLIDASGAGHDGTISSSGVTYRVAGIARSSGTAETTDGSSGAMTSGFVPASGSFSLSFYVNLKSNPNNFGRLAATGDPKNSSNHSGWYIVVNSGSTNPIFASLGTGTGTGTSLGFIPLALNTPANVTLTYSASSNQATFCVATTSSPTCATQTLPASYVASGNAITFGGPPSYYPVNATFDEAAYYQGTVLSSADIATLGGDAGSGTTSTPTPIASSTPVSGPTSAPVPSATPTRSPSPAPSTSAAFNDFTTYGFDSARDMFNPNSAAFTPASIAGSGLHLAWQVSLGGGNQAQPLVLTNVGGHAALLIVVARNNISAYDGVTGAKVWGPTALGSQNLQSCGTGGIAGTPIYDAAIPALIVAAGSGGNNPNHVMLSQISVTSGSVIKTVDATPNLLTNEQVSAHDGMLFNNGKIYIGTGSNCESASWRGRVLEVDPGTLAIDGTFFTTYGQGGNYGGGGIWAWGGVSGDAAGNVYVASGNAETPHSTLSGTPAPPFVGTTDEQAGYAEHLAKVSSDLTTVLDSNYPGFNFNEGYADLDFTGTPVLFRPSGCDQLSGTQGKGGTLVIHDTTNLASPTSYMLSEAAGTADYIGNPAYSPNTQLLYAAVASSQGGSLEPPGMVALQFSCPGGSSSILWHTAFGPDSFGYSGTTPRSAPAATAGGVVFMGTPCTPSGSTCGSPSGSPNGALWAVDASTGAVLGGGDPVLMTPDHIRMAPTIDGQWMWVQDNSGNLYGMTIDPSVKSTSVRRANREAASARYPNL